MQKIKIGVMVPTRGDRQIFLSFCLKQINRQTLQPDEICIVDEKPKDERPDITYRYKKGIKELSERGCDLIFFFEDDDWYSPYYIEIMTKKWLQANKPDVIGIGNTIYYNLFTQKYVFLDHPVRASMMSMAVTPAILDIKWCDDNYSFTDMVLCQQAKTKFIINDLKDTPICCGIKHGIGLCGGGGHVLDWKIYNKQDSDFKYLESIVENDIMFYRGIVFKQKYKIKKILYSENPFLSIITRTMKGKRNNFFTEHIKSIVSLKQKDFEQIFIIDEKGYGMLEANRSFSFVVDDIKGDYVYLLDDDDIFVNADFVKDLKEVSKQTDADVIFFKMKILTGDGDNIYPKPDNWETREMKRARIGGSCFVVKKWVYEKYIAKFALPSFGDWNFINEVSKDKKVKFAWLDKLMSETLKVSRGK